MSSPISRVRRASRLALAGVASVALWSGAATAPAADAPSTVWVEGEAPASADVFRHPWWYDQVKKHELSGGDWISNFKKDSPATVAYRFAAPAAGEYRFWLRANPTQSAMECRLNDGEWKPVDFGAATDTRNVAADDKPDLRFIAWIDLGKVPLKPGENEVTFRMTSANERHGAIDAFTFTTDEAFAPAGAARPGGPRQRVPTDPGSWAFTPDPDRYSADALLDLRGLNEDVAGQSGFVRRSPDGPDFVRGDGQPIRFWCVNSTVYEKGRAALDDHAAFLAKRGVNMVRWHGNLPPVHDPDSELSQINEEALDELFQLVAAMKQEGIYLTISPYYPHATHTKGDDKQLRFKNWDGITEGSDANNPTGLLFYHPEVQSAYKAWLKELFSRPNPHANNKPLKDEPAVAIFQIQNEDSLLFWTVNQIGGRDLDVLRKQFGQWLAGKYGSLEKARAAWDNAEPQGAKVPDDWAAGLVSLPNVWHMTQPVDEASGFGRRLADTTQFLTETMRNWNEEVERYLREELGAKHLINAGNWRTADPVRLNDAERYSYTANDVIGMNRYVGGVHKGPHEGWAIVNGDKFTDPSVLLNPGNLAVALKQPRGHPFIIPESNWVPPMGYQGEGPFLTAVISSLNGVDGLYWFSTGETQWRQPGSANGYLPSEGKWVIATPEVMGNFPAAALLFRKGYVDRAEPVVVEHRSLEDVYHRRVPVISEEGAFDPNRDAGSFAPESPVKTELDRLAFLVGPVEAVYDSDAKQTHVADLDKHIDRERKVVTSATGQVKWDYGAGVCTVNAPKAQGAAGFLRKGGGRFELGDVTIRSGDEYATVLVVSMDDKPLRESGNVLAQVGTIARPTGWEQREATWNEDGRRVQGFEVVDYGRAPWAVRESDVTVTIRSAAVTKATILDLNGLATGDVELTRDGAAATFRMPKDAKYVVLHR